MKKRPTTGGRFVRDPETGEVAAAAAGADDAKPIGPVEDLPHFTPLETDTPTAPTGKAPARAQKRK